MYSFVVKILINGIILREVAIMFALEYREIGLKISYYRKKRGYTQAQLAEKVEISTNYMGMIERGNAGKSYSLETFLSIVKALDIDAKDLVKDL